LGLTPVISFYNIKNSLVKKKFAKCKIIVDKAIFNLYLFKYGKNKTK